MDRKATGELIARRRKAMGLTQKNLAEKIGVTNKAVSKWENGEGLPDVGLLSALAEALDISVDALLKGETAERRVNIVPVKTDDTDWKMSFSAEEPLLPRQEENRKQAVSILFVIAVVCLYFSFDTSALWSHIVELIGSLFFLIGFCCCRGENEEFQKGYRYAKCYTLYKAGSTVWKASVFMLYTKVFLILDLVIDLALKLCLLYRLMEGSQLLNEKAERFLRSRQDQGVWIAAVIYVWVAMLRFWAPEACHISIAMAGFALIVGFLAFRVWEGMQIWRNNPECRLPKAVGLAKPVLLWSVSTALCALAIGGMTFALHWSREIVKTEQQGEVLETEAQEIRGRLLDGGFPLNFLQYFDEAELLRYKNVKQVVTDKVSDSVTVVYCYLDDGTCRAAGFYRNYADEDGHEIKMEREEYTFVGDCDTDILEKTLEVYALYEKDGYLERAEPEKEKEYSSLAQYRLECPEENRIGEQELGVLSYEVLNKGSYVVTYRLGNPGYDSKCTYFTYVLPAKAEERLWVYHQYRNAEFTFPFTGPMAAEVDHICTVERVVRWNIQADLNGKKASEVVETLSGFLYSHWVNITCVEIAKLDLDASGRYQGGGLSVRFRSEAENEIIVQNFSDILGEENTFLYVEQRYPDSDTDRIAWEQMLSLRDCINILKWLPFQEIPIDAAGIRLSSGTENIPAEEKGHCYWYDSSKVKLKPVKAGLLLLHPLTFRDSRGEIWAFAAGNQIGTHKIV